MSGSEQDSSQPQFIASHENRSVPSGPGAPLIDSIDVDQIIIPEVSFLMLLYFSCLYCLHVFFFGS